MGYKTSGPSWPRLMNIEVACAYLGAIDREMFIAAIVPSLTPISLSHGVVLYDRRQIDAWVDKTTRGNRVHTDDDWLKALRDA